MLGYASLEPESIHEGVRRLSRALGNDWRTRPRSR
jgi:hypothetical protein